MCCLLQGCSFKLPLCALANVQGHMHGQWLVRVCTQLGACYPETECFQPRPKENASRSIELHAVLHSHLETQLVQLTLLALISQPCLQAHMKGRSRKGQAKDADEVRASRAEARAEKRSARENFVHCPFPHYQTFRAALIFCLPSQALRLAE